MLIDKGNNLFLCRNNSYIFLQYVSGYALKGLRHKIICMIVKCFIVYICCVYTISLWTIQMFYSYMTPLVYLLHNNKKKHVFLFSV